MSEAAKLTDEFELTGGALCLDFTNTLGDRPRCREEHLPGYGELLRWSRQAEVLTAAEVNAIAREAEKRPRLAEAAFEQAIELRETIYRIFAALARSERPANTDIEALNTHLHQALPYLELLRGYDSITWSWGGPERSLERMLWPVARSAADLLTSDEAVALRECDSETCSWLFVDRSRTKRRRWCDMSTCGNRAKARRHYQRSKQERSSG
jgi:predicted RNA-binding Zn ribbon-like protein